MQEKDILNDKSDDFNQLERYVILRLIRLCKLPVYCKGIIKYGWKHFGNHIGLKEDISTVLVIMTSLSCSYNLLKNRGEIRIEIDDCQYHSKNVRVTYYIPSFKERFKSLS